MDLEAVRTVVAIADAGRFQDAAVDLSVTQQAVSKRVAALERELGVRLFVRGAGSTRPTVDGEAFLPHARDLLRAAERAAASVRPGARALRVDVVGRRLAPADLLRGFRDARPGTELDVLTLRDAAAAVDAVRAGSVDACVRAVDGRRLPEGVVSIRVLDEALQLLTGPAHALAEAGSVATGRLAGHRIWMPGLVPGTEWAAYYADLAAAFGLTIEATGPDFGTEPLLDTIAGSPALATIVGEGTGLVRPADDGLRRVGLRDPVPVYPHSLVWRADNPHPALAALRDRLAAAREHTGGRTWTPHWAH
ncbi:DNA-binding transcriptional LysR family regulator [Nocardiopsis sp. Huas11]|uniref:LysR family transcriptional regulator n=1 Tax=Nocardiopsis sp. Huas11 TaxID=2183912 RepID=UPI000EB4DE2B|nr:LysR family transcriptional regulator [Nocardiopsis sp. Huas11]RKS10434.1 DNA-binding transcriptional LysR family regulator [Nocardiopsis sp. Huas11]